jgi:hypothetical protein
MKNTIEEISSIEKSLKILPLEKIKALPTHRMLSYYRKIRKQFDVWEHYQQCECCGEMLYVVYPNANTKEDYDKTKNHYLKIINEIKKTLNTKEHVAKRK